MVKKGFIAIAFVLVLGGIIFLTYQLGVNTGETRITQDTLLTSEIANTLIALKASSEINRTKTILFPDDEYEWNRMVLIHLTGTDQYYHFVGCDFISNNSSNPLFVSEYEAIYRGYTPCPNCVFPTVKIK